MYKNRLQEICQKMKVPLPIYITNPTQLPGPKKVEGFISKVIFFDKEWEGIACRRKVEAEISAAASALYFYEQHPDIWNEMYDEHANTYNKYSVDEKVQKSIGKRCDNILVIVDLENIQKVTVNDLLGAYGEGFCTLRTVEMYKTDIPITVVNSTRKDAADVAMIMYISQLLTDIQLEYIILLSKDNIMSSVVDVWYTIYKKFHDEKPTLYEIYHAVSLQDCQDKIREIADSVDTADISGSADSNSK